MFINSDIAIFQLALNLEDTKLFVESVVQNSNIRFQLHAPSASLMGSKSHKHSNFLTMLDASDAYTALLNVTTLGSTSFMAHIRGRTSGKGACGK